MHAPSRSSGLRDVVAASLAYVMVGIITAGLAGAAASLAATKAWRLAGWALSLAVFMVHVVASRHRQPGSPLGAAARVAIAVAVAALVLAIVGPVRGHWGEPAIGRVALLSVVLWPLMTGIPAFGVAVAVGHVIDRIGRRASGSSRPD
jgi:hypothetical protein